MSNQFATDVNDAWKEYQETCPHNEGQEEGGYHHLCSHKENGGISMLDNMCMRCNLLNCPNAEDVYAIARNRKFIERQDEGTIDFTPPKGFEGKDHLKLVVNR